jgi:brefeldin A-resistance guanine nucleotide exchange factor 1
VLLVERAVVGLLRLCRIAANKVIIIQYAHPVDSSITVQPILRDQIYISLDILGGLPPMVFNAVTEQIVAGLALLVQEHPTTIS